MKLLLENNLLKQELIHLEKSGSSFKEVEIDSKINDYYVQSAEVIKMFGGKLIGAGGGGFLLFVTDKQRYNCGKENE